MEFDGALRSWKEALAQTDDGRQVLRNFESEKCLPAAVVGRFLDALYSLPVPADSAAACAGLRQVIEQDAAVFLLQGREVPADRMRVVCRLEAIGDLLYRRPDLEHGKDGYSFDQLSDLAASNPDEFSLVLDATGSRFHLGRPGSVVWVADHSDVEHGIKVSARDVCDRLGAAHLLEHECLLIYIYERDQVRGELRVPPCLDGGANPAFELVADCRAPTGQTRTVSNGEPGYAEAVH